MRERFRYHGYGDPDSKIVSLEMKEMKASISTNGSDKKWWDFRELYGVPCAHSGESHDALS